MSDTSPPTTDPDADSDPDVESPRVEPAPPDPEWARTVALELSDPDDPWVRRGNIKAHGSRNGRDSDDVKEAIQRARFETTHLLEWYGLVAPTTDEALLNVIRAERESDISRHTLIGKANELRQQLRDEATPDTADSSADESDSA